MMNNTPKQQLHDLSLYFEGMADALDGKKCERIRDAARWLMRASENICRQGYFGCCGGEKCASDHK